MEPSASGSGSISTARNRLERRKSSVLPFVKVPLRPLRESNTVPFTLSNFLEGNGTGRRRSLASKTEEEDEEKMSKSPPFCRWIYHALLLVLMGIVITLCVGATYFEIMAYLGDMEWNRILDGRSTFSAKAVAGDVVFGGKKLTEVTRIFPKSATQRQIDIKKYLFRDLSLERVFLCLVLLIFICGIVVLLQFLLMGVDGWRERLLVVYNGFGTLGMLLFLAVVLNVCSVLVHIPKGFIHVREILEDEFGLPDNRTHLPHEFTRHIGIGNWPMVKITNNCEVATAARDSQELQRLLDVIKICVYSRYVTMNHNDPCRKKEIKNYIAVDDTKNYTVMDLEALRICPMDRYKLIAVGYVFTAGIICFIIMMIGSYASKTLFPHNNIHSSLLYQPGAVHAIDDISARPEHDVPSEMQLGRPDLWNHDKRTSILQTTSAPTRDPAEQWKTIIQQKVGVQRTMAAWNSTSGLSGEIQRPNPIASIMNIAPQMVIHPSTRKSASVLQTPEGQNQKSSWFDG